jgi:hypothetical protein
MAKDELHIFLDSQSLDKMYTQKKAKIDRLLQYNKKPFIINRSSFEPDSDELKTVNVTGSEKTNHNSNIVTVISKLVLKETLTDNQKEFLYLIVKHTLIQQKPNNPYVDNILFVTENTLFLEKFISQNKCEFSLRSFSVFEIGRYRSRTRGDGYLC